MTAPPIQPSFCGIGNDADRYYVSSQSSTVSINGGKEFVIKNLLIDTSCNSNMLYFESCEQLEEFCAASISVSLVSIDGTGGVGILQCPLLRVEGAIDLKIGRNFRVSPGKMRFHLCREDVFHLIKLTKTRKADESGPVLDEKSIVKFELLHRFVDLIAELEPIADRYGLKLTFGRRKHGLLGQDSLKSVMVLQHARVCLVLPANTMSTTGELFDYGARFRETCLKSELYLSSFHDLEDSYDDGAGAPKDVEIDCSWK